MSGGGSGAGPWGIHLKGHEHPGGDGPPSVHTETGSLSQQEFADRAAGAIIGSIIGDALGVGAHWYYNLDDLVSRYGTLSYYVQPQADWYHATLPTGSYSQSAEQAILLLESLSHNTSHKYHYRQVDFCSRMDALFNTLTIEDFPYTGRAEYVDRQVRDVCIQRREQKLEWLDPGFGTWTDTSEGSQRGIVLAARYAYDRSLQTGSEQVWQNTRLTYQDPFTLAHSIAFTAVLSHLIQGSTMTHDSIAVKLQGAVKSGLYGLTAQPTGTTNLPVHLSADDATYRRPSVDRTVNNPDALLLPVFILKAVNDGGLSLKDDKYASCVWGQSCSIPYVLGGSYYLAHKYRQDFSAGILAAANGGGQNVARCAHVGGLIGAQVGLSGIEQRWLDGLQDAQKLVPMAKQVAEAAAQDWAAGAVAVASE